MGQMTRQPVICVYGTCMSTTLCLCYGRILFFFLERISRHCMIMEFCLNYLEGPKAAFLAFKHSIALGG